MAIIKRFVDTEFKLVVHDNGFELFVLKADAKHCGDYDYENPFEYWEDGYDEDQMLEDQELSERSHDHEGYKDDGEGLVYGHRE